MSKSNFFSKVNHFKLFLVKLQVPKMNSFTRISQVFAKSLSNLVHDFWEDYFYKPNLLLAANRLIYLDISISISKIYGIRPPCVS